MLFLCNCILHNKFNLPRVNLVFTLKLAKVLLYQFSYPISDRFCDTRSDIIILIDVDPRTKTGLFQYPPYTSCILQDNIVSNAKKHYKPKILPFPAMISLLVMFYCDITPSLQTKCINNTSYQSSVSQLAPLGLFLMLQRKCFNTKLDSLFAFLFEISFTTVKYHVQQIM